MLTGVYDDFMRLEIEDKTFVYHWSRVIEWNEASRYKMNKTELFEVLTKEAVEDVLSVCNSIPFLHNAWTKEDE